MGSTQSSLRRKRSEKLLTKSQRRSRKIASRYSNIDDYPDQNTLRPIEYIANEVVIIGDMAYHKSMVPPGLIEEYTAEYEKQLQFKSCLNNKKSPKSKNVTPGPYKADQVEEYSPAHDDEYIKESHSFRNSSKPNEPKQLTGSKKTFSLANFSKMNLMEGNKDEVTLFNVMDTPQEEFSSEESVAHPHEQGNSVPITSKLLSKDYPQSSKYVQLEDNQIDNMIEPVKNHTKHSASLKQLKEMTSLYIKQAPYLTEDFSPPSPHSPDLSPLPNAVLAPYEDVMAVSKSLIQLSKRGSLKSIAPT